MKELNRLMQQQFMIMCNTHKLFRSRVSGDKVWETYLSSFKEDPIFRDPESSTHNCNQCKNFVRRYGNLVALDENNNIITIWDVEAPEEYFDPVKAVSNLLKSSSIQDVFIETYDMLNSLPYESCSKTNTVFRLGIDKNIKRYTKEEAEKFGVVKPNEIRTFNHLFLNIPSEFIDKSGKSVEAIQGYHRDNYSVFKRAMEEISLDTLSLVKDLINQDSLLDGKTHLSKVEEMIILKSEYDNLTSNKNKWCWKSSYNLRIAKFKNELIGVLCSDISLGVDLNTACQLWNKRVDPVNYMKTTAPITKKQIEDAKRFVEENGYEESFIRRCATIDDIKASEILHLNNVGKKSISIFDSVKSSKTSLKFDFDKIEEVSIDKFMSDILPNCTSVEAYLQNSHKNNLVTLTTADNKDSKPMFKWSNNYSWTFNGNLAGKSEIKEAVKSAGGITDAVLRFSIMWNEDGRSIVDFDAHAVEPNGLCICFSSYNGYKTPMSGMLDIDMINPSKVGVENIFWTDKSKMKNGKYDFYIRNYNGNINNGVKAEISFEDQVFTYHIDKPVYGKLNIANITLKDGKLVDICHLSPLVSKNQTSTNIYNLDTLQFHKVNLMCLSPNHWNNNQVGNKFYFFMLENCKAPEDIRSFHNENLNAELTQHRKVIEVLGNTTKVKSTDNQLSGLGFNATVRDELIVKLKGTFNRIIKIKF